MDGWLTLKLLEGIRISVLENFEWISKKKKDLISTALSSEIQMLNCTSWFLKPWKVCMNDAFVDKQFIFIHFQSFTYKWLKLEIARIGIWDENKTKNAPFFCQKMLRFYFSKPLLLHTLLGRDSLCFCLFSRCLRLSVESTKNTKLLKVRDINIPAPAGIHEYKYALNRQIERKLRATPVLRSRFEGRSLVAEAAVKSRKWFRLRMRSFGFSSAEMIRHTCFGRDSWWDFRACNLGSFILKWSDMYEGRRLFGEGGRGKDFH